MPSRGRPRDPAGLFAEYRESGSVAAREALIEHFLPLARSVANRYRHTPQPIEDLVQVACVALVKAVDGFDPDRGIAFSSYAVPTIIGEIKRHFRDTAWALHVPRALKERVLLVERCERDLSARSGRAPTVDELSLESGLSSEAVLGALEARSAHDAESIDGGREQDDGTPYAEGLGAPDERLGLVAERSELGTAMGRLSEREREIVRLRFADELTQTEIAARVGVSQMQVSRLLRRALDVLRTGVDPRSP